MRVNYKGMDAGYKYRIAEISFDRSEQKLYEKIEKVMAINGYNLEQITDDYALCSVDDYSEYKQFVKRYKEVKKSAKLWIKYNI